MDTRWKHTIEPDIVYNYVTGVNDFGRFIRFDEDETLTDTNEVEYGITQRLYRRTDGGDAEELVTWQLAQKYFFDPTFGGALVPGQRNVFQTLDDLTPFAFADEPRRFSPIVSDLTIEPGKHYDTQFILNYDPQRNRMTAIGTLLKLKPYKQSFLTLAHFSTLNLPLNPPVPPPNFQQRSNQMRALIGYGDLTRPRLERDVRRQLRFHAERIPKPDCGSQLQRLMLWHRFRVSQILFRHDPKRKPVPRDLPYRKRRFGREPAARRENLLMPRVRSAPNLRAEPRSSLDRAGGAACCDARKFLQSSLSKRR